MKKKRIVSLGLASVMMISAMLTGCGKGAGGTQESPAVPAAPAADGSKVEISFINGFTGGDGGYMKKITEGFNASQDKYHIVESQEKDHYVKYKSGNYDMVVIHGDRLKTYVEDDMLQDVSPIYEKAGLTLDDFAAAGKDIVSINEGVYAFPLDIHPLVMFYNKELVQEAPKTYEDLLRLQAELTAKDPNLYAMGIPGLGLVEFYYMALATQNGLEIEKDGYLNFDNDEFAALMKQFNDMVFVDKISPAKLGMDGEFKTFVQDPESGVASQTAVALTGPWYYGAVKEKFGDNLGIAPIPTIGRESGSYGNAHTIAVSADVTEEKINGIAEFLKYMYQPDVLINWADAGQAPLHVDTMDYITEHQEEYPLAYVNIQQFANCKIAPQVYNVGEQTKYLNETLFTKLISAPMTLEEIKAELKKATEIAKEVSEGM